MRCCRASRSHSNAAHISIAVDGQGRPLLQNGRYVVNPTGFLHDLPPTPTVPLPEGASYRPLGSFFDTERFRDHQRTLQRLRPVIVAEKQALHQPSVIGDRLQIAGALSKLDQGLLVIGLAMAGIEAQAALQRGDREGAQAVLSRWARETAGGLAGAELASLLAAPLIATGPLNTHPCRLHSFGKYSQELLPVDGAISTRHFNSATIDISLSITQANVTNGLIQTAKNIRGRLTAHHTDSRVKYDLQRPGADTRQ